MPRALPRHCYCERNRRSGAPMYYVRVGHGSRIRIKAAFGTAEFETEYQSAISGKAPPRKTGPTAGSLASLIDRYREVNAWISLSPATRRQRENIFKQVNRDCWR